MKLPLTVALAFCLIGVGSVTTTGHHPMCLSNETNPGWALDSSTTVLQVSVGGAMACTIDQSNSLTCVTGESAGGKTNPYIDIPEPSKATNFVLVSAGYDHGCVLTNHGTVGCWGNNSEGQCDPPGWEIEE